MQSPTNEALRKNAQGRLRLADRANQGGHLHVHEIREHEAAARRHPYQRILYADCMATPMQVGSTWSFQDSKSDSREFAAFECAAAAEAETAEAAAAQAAAAAEQTAAAAAKAKAGRKAKES